MTQFRATPTSGQSITGAVETEVTFGTEEFDTDGVFAASRFTVPAGWNGLHAELYGGILFTASESGHLAVQVSTNGGGVWTSIARNNFEVSVHGTVQSGALLMATGDIYRLVTQTDTASTTATGERGFFSGRVVNLSDLFIHEYFRVTNSATQAIPNVSLTPVTLSTEIYDEGANVVSGVYTVPADHNGGYGVLSAGFKVDGTNANEDPHLYITKSTDGGSTYPISQMATMNNNANGVTASTGPIALVTGDKYRLEAYTISGGFTLANSPMTFLSGEMYATTVADPVFRAVKSATTQSFGAAAEVVFDSEVFDTSNSFAANRYTVDAQHNGYYLKFQAGVLCDNFENHNISLEVSTDGGTGWTEVVVDGDGTNENLNLTSGPLIANTGDIYRIVYQLVSGATIMQNDPRTFFSGYGHAP